MVKNVKVTKKSKLGLNQKFVDEINICNEKLKAKTTYSINLISNIRLKVSEINAFKAN